MNNGGPTQKQSRHKAVTWSVTSLLILAQLAALIAIVPGVAAAASGDGITVAPAADALSIDPTTITVSVDITNDDASDLADLREINDLTFSLVADGTETCGVTPTVGALTNWQPTNGPDGWLPDSNDGAVWWRAAPTTGLALGETGTFEFSFDDTGLLDLDELAFTVHAWHVAEVGADADPLNKVGTGCVTYTLYDLLTIDSALTRDINTDGTVDSIELTFNHDVSTVDAAEFTVGGQTPASATPDSADASIWTLEVAGLTADDTSITPALTFAGTNTVDAFGQNPASLPTNAADGAGPMMVAGRTIDAGLDGDIDAVQITFSETFAYGIQASDVEDGGIAFASISGTNPYLLTYSSAIPDTGHAPTLDFDAALADAAGNLVVPSGNVEDDATPIFMVATTDDRDNNGMLDRVTMHFSEDIQAFGSVNDADFSVAGYALATAPATAIDSMDASMLHIDLVESGVIDGAATPDLTFTVTAGNGLEDMVGLPVATPITATPADGISPRITSAVTSTAGGDSDDTVVDQIVVTFSEDIISTCMDTAFLVNPAAYSVDSRVLGADSITFELDTTEITVGDTAATPTLLYQPTTSCINDGTMDWAAGDIYTTDAVAPLVTSVATGDADSDGLIDNIVVSFSEPMDDTTFEAADWAVTDLQSVASLDVGGESITLQLTSEILPATDANPWVTYDASLGGSAVVLADMAGNAWVEPLPGTTDAAPPVLLAVEAPTASHDFRLVFSEGVDNAACALIADAFTYVDAAGDAQTLAGATVDHTAGNAVVILHLDGATPKFGMADFNMDSVAPAEDAVFDASANAASTDAVLLNELALVILDAWTVDDGNGMIDQIVLEFNMDVTSGGDAGEWTVAGYDVTAASAAGGNNLVTLTLAEGGFDTGAMPLISYDGALGSSSEPQTSAMFSGLTVSLMDFTNSDVVRDAALPQVVEVLSADGIDLVRVIFSEPVYSQVEGTGMLGTAKFTVTDEPVGALDILSLDSDGTIFDLKVDGVLALTDVELETVVVDTFYDASGNTNTDSLDITAFAGPTFEAVTADTDANGLLDQVMLIFQTPIADPEFTAAHAAEFTVAGFPATAISTGSTSNDEVIILDFAETNLGTGALPVITYTYGGTGLFDMDGQLVVPASATMVYDNAAPVLVSATSNPGSTDITLTFSEDVEGTGSTGTQCAATPGGNLLLTNLYYTDVNGVGVAYPQAVNPQLVGNTATLAMNTEVLFADLDEAGTRDTIEVRDVVRDCVGLELIPQEISLTDVDAPTIIGSETVDSDDNGRIDAIKIQFSEHLDIDTIGSTGFDIHDFNYGGIWEVIWTGTGMNGKTYENDDPSVAFLTFAERIDVVSDSGVTPEFTFDGDGSISDLAGNMLGASGLQDPADAVAPFIVDAATRDADGNGILDGFELTFSEDLECPDVAETGFTVTERTVTDATCAGSDAIHLDFDEGLTGDTSFVPQVTYDATGTIADTAGNALLAVGEVNDLFEEMDGALPILWRVTSNPGSDTAIAWFSEGVHNGAGGELHVGSFDYNGFASGVQAITAVDHVAGASVATLTLDGELTQGEFNAGGDSIQASIVNPIFDLNPATTAQAVPAVAVEYGDITGPTALSVTTVDGGNGFLDALKITFDEDIDGATVAMEDFTVDGYDVLAISEMDGVITLTLDEGMVADTNAVPMVTYTTGTTAVTDISGQAWEGIMPATTDMAAPVIMDASGTLGDPYVRVVFSEPVYLNDDATGALTAADFAYTDVDTTGAASIVSVEHDGGVAEATVRVDALLIADDVHATNGDTLAAGTFYDGAGNAASTTPVILGELVGPMVTSITTLDLDQNGFLDALDVTFSADLADPEFTQEFVDSFTVTHDTLTYMVTGVNTGMAADDATLRILIAQDGATPDTGMLPKLDYARNLDAPLHAADGGVVASIGLPIEAHFDGAPAVLVYANGNPGSDAIQLTFSEPVTGSGSGGQLLMTNFIYSSSNGLGASAIYSITESNGNDGAIGIQLNDLVAPEDILMGGVRDAVIPKASVTGTDGAPVLVLAASLSDVDAPGIATVSTVDGDMDGYLDAFLVTFTETIDPATLDTTGFSVSPSGYALGLETLASGTASNGVTYEAQDGPAVYVAFTEGSMADTGFQPDFGYEAIDGTLADLAGNLVPDVAIGPADDAAAPVLIAASTMDANGNGLIDGYAVTASEDVDCSTPLGFMIDGVAATTLVGCVGDSFTLTFAEATSAVGNTDSTPQLTYSGAGDVKEMAPGTLGLLAATDGDLAETDGAKAVLMHIIAQPGMTALTAVFSEGVDNGGQPALGLEADHFRFVDSDGDNEVGLITSVDHTAGASTATLHFDNGVVATASNDVLDMTDGIRVRSNAVFDEAGNIVPTDLALMRDLVAPVMTLAEILDTDTDGLVDKIELSFDEALSGLIEPEDFQVAGYTVTGTSYASNVVEIVLAEGTTGDTGATPGVSYTPAEGTWDTGITDMSADFNAWTGSSFVPADKAVPQLMTVETLDADMNGLLDGATLTFSEDIMNAAMADFSISGETLTDATENAGVVTLSFDQTVANLDTAEVFGVSYVAPMTDFIVDAADQPLASFGPVVAEDNAAPVMTLVEAFDDNGNGKLDTIEAYFSEDIATGDEAEDWSVAGETVSILLHPDGPTVTITEGDAMNTDATPALVFDATQGVTLDNAPADAAGNAWNGYIPATKDRMAPVFGSASTVDSDANGLLDAVRVTLSEPVDPATLDVADFLSFSDPVADVSALSLDNGDLLVHIDETVDMLSTDENPDVNFGGGSLADFAGNAMTAESRLSLDKAAPVILGATTSETGTADGTIDTITVEFSEPVTDAFLELEDFMVDTHTVDAVSMTGSPSAFVTLDLVAWPDAYPNTDIVPWVYYDASMGATVEPVVDASGNDLIHNAGDEIVAADGAGPVILYANYVGDSLVEVVFSEATFSEDDATGELGPNDFAHLAGAGDSRTVTGVNHLAGNWDATIVFSTDFADADLAPGANADAIGAATAPDQIFDASGNPAALQMEDITAYPRLIAATSVDQDLDGYVDAIQLTFSEAIDDVDDKNTPDASDDTSNLDVFDWFVDSWYGWGEPTEVLTSLTDPVPAGHEDDDTIYLTIPDDWVMDGEFVFVTYWSDGSIRDLQGFAMKEGALEVTDGIAPRIAEAVTVDTDVDGMADTVRVVFTEDVDGGMDAAQWTIDGAEPTNVGGFGMFRTLELATPTAGDAMPMVSYAGTSVTDGINVMAPVIDFPAADDVRPVLLSVTSTGPGRDVVNLAFSEPVFGTGTDGAIVSDDLLYTDNNAAGATDIASIISHTGNMVAVQLDAGLLVADTDSDTDDSISPWGIEDDAGNSVAFPRPDGIDVDAIAPATISDAAIATDGLTASSALLTFTAPGDDDNTGTVFTYEVLHHSETITEENMGDATVAATVAFVPEILGVAGETQTVLVTGLAKTTEYHFAVVAVDEAGNKGGLSNIVLAETLADDTAPTGTLTVSSTTHNHDAANKLSDVTLTWTEMTDDESTLEYYTAVNDQATYEVTKADDLAAQRSLSLSDLDDAIHYVHVAAISEGGKVQADAFKLVIDGAAPAKITGLQSTATTALTISLEWAAGTDSGPAGLDKYDVRYSTSSFTASAFESQTAASGVPTPGTSKATYTLSGLSKDTTYHVAVRAIDDAGNKGPVSDVLEVSTAPDTSAPVGSLGLTSTTHSQDVGTLINDVKFVWTAAADPESTVAYRYALTDSASYTLSSSDNVTTALSQSYADLAAGTYYFHVAAESDGGLGTTESFVVVINGITQQEIDQANQGIKVNVLRETGKNTVTWTLPDELPATPAGLQIWSSNSPFTLLATLPADGEAYTSGQYVDESPEALATTKYAVTLFYEGDNGKGAEGEPYGGDAYLNNIAVGLPSDDSTVFGSVSFYLGLLAAMGSIAILVVAVVWHNRSKPEVATPAEVDA